MAAHGDLDENSIAEIVDGAEGMSTLDAAELKRMVTAFEKKVRINEKNRMKFPDQPDKFMDSELELDEAVGELQVVAGAPELYSDMVKMGLMQTILGLIPHENTDISVSAIALLHEITDPETAVEADDPVMLVDALVKNSLFELMVQNLKRLDEAVEEDQQGVHDTMGVIENLVELEPVVVDIICQKTEILPWLTERLREKRKPLRNRIYVSEILSILLQNSPANQKKFAQQKDSVGKLLEVVAAYKRKDPQNSEEEEFVENAFDVLCNVLLLPEGQEFFLKDEGLELLIIMIKEKKFARRRALKVLDFALNGNPVNCERWVEILGLKTLFSAFMKKSGSKASEEQEDEEHAVSTIVNLLKSLHGDSLKRVLNKFLEDNHAKVERLIELHIKYNRKVAGAHIVGMGENDEDAKENAYMARLDSGLFVLQLTDLILATIIIKARDSVKDKAMMMLQQRDIPLSRILSTLREYQDNLGEDSEDANAFVSDLLSRFAEFVDDGEEQDTEKSQAGDMPPPDMPPPSMPPPRDTGDAVD